MIPLPNCRLLLDPRLLPPHWLLANSYVSILLKQGAPEQLDMAYRLSSTFEIKVFFTAISCLHLFASSRDFWNTALFFFLNTLGLESLVVELSDDDEEYSSVSSNMLTGRFFGLFLFTVEVMVEFPLLWKLFSSLKTRVNWLGNVGRQGIIEGPICFREVRFTFRPPS